MGLVILVTDPNPSVHEMCMGCVRPYATPCLLARCEGHAVQVVGPLSELLLGGVHQVGRTCSEHLRWGRVRVRVSCSSGAFIRSVVPVRVRVRE